MTSSRARPRPDDSGVSLIEVLVSMAVMSVVMALFTTGTLQLFSAAGNTESLTVASQQIHNAFLRLDKGIRYSSGISDEGTAGGSKYVEYAITNTGAMVCNQLRLTPGGLLQSRTKVGTAAAGPWSTLASGLIPSGSSFRETDASVGANPYQQLTVSLVSEAGAGSSRQQDTAAFTFTALNTSTSTSSATICTSLDRT